MISSDQSGLSADEISMVTKEQVERVLGTSNYQNAQMSQWTASIIDQTIAQLTKLNKPYKYIATCAIVQKTGAGFNMSSACYWDNTTDGHQKRNAVLCRIKPASAGRLYQGKVNGIRAVTATVRWENKTMYCVVTVHACAI